MFRKTLALLGALRILLLATPAMANETPVEKFYVYGRICKGVNLQGTFPTIEEACAAAAKYRSQGMTQVSVRTGAHDFRDELGTAAAHYRVYQCGVRRNGSPVCLLHATAANADKAKQIRDQLKMHSTWPVEIVPHYGKFAVFGDAGRCSRSITLKGTYETIAAACAAAQKFRKEGLGHVSVRIGKGDYLGTAARQYQVYRRGCKGSWSLYATAYSAATANEIGDHLKKSSPRVEVEIVHHST